MAVMVTARGKECSGDAMETLYKEYMENHKNGTSTFRTEEKYRILFEGIACWPYLRATSTGLKSRGINMVTTIYADAFGYDYDSFEGMIKAYCSVPNAINLEKSRDKRIKLCKDNHVEGMLIHTNRSCKLWSGFMYEMGRQVGKPATFPWPASTAIRPIPATSPRRSMTPACRASWRSWKPTKSRKEPTEHDHQ